MNREKGRDGRRAPWLAGMAGLLLGGAATALAIGGDGAMAQSGQPDRAAIEAIVRDYILNHPEILPEAMERLQAREVSKRLEADRQALETPFPGAWAGAAKPDVTLVMFTDYSCGYCRASVADVDRLLAEDPRLRVVWRELPILGPQSEEAARAALAAAGQGRYLDFHRRIFAGGVPNEAKLARAGAAAGLDAAKLKAAGASPAIGREIETNIALATRLGLSGTPAFVIGNQLLTGAVGHDALKKAIAEARARS
ncbi:disulfide bond formation protein DsbA [Sphingomonas oleivorans]|uniref:Disulfide bond formation protein DsbA n=1 Tax=Sphingomonas oleivorans TaxID=1735121 RepID=A0A2T5FZW5_9SPHN|nr:DsbA family protein [Sphingomonas oleivorans]PTQ12253.1 disulfide bond formation protein DsbA [Sphingomonas oleivorans]